VFWVISVYFNIRNTRPKSGTFLLGHPVYTYIGCPERNVPDVLRMFLKLKYTDITQTPISKVERLRRYWREKSVVFLRFYVLDLARHVREYLTLILLMWRIGWANNARKWQVGFNSAFKGLNESFPNRWLSRVGPNAWPTRSPDLTTPLDYYIWGHMKTLAYKTKVDSRAALRDRIFAAAEHTQSSW